MHEGEKSRAVYLPAGNWVDYQNGKSYAGGWHQIEAGPVRAVVMVRDGAAIPQIPLAQSTAQMDWSKVELSVFAKEATTAKALVCLPSKNQLEEVILTKTGGVWKPVNKPFAVKLAAATPPAAQP
jgi:alpha-D-xyloside xylohydrolase